MRRFAALLFVMPLLLACDNFATYSIDNRTDQPLLTRASRYNCDANSSKGYREIEVPPMATSLQEIVLGGGGSLDCIYVLTLDRQILLMERPMEGKTYVIDHPPAPDAPRLPELQNRRPWRPLVGTGLTLPFSPHH